LASLGKIRQLNRSNKVRELLRELRKIRRSFANLFAANRSSIRHSRGGSCGMVNAA
jgi:hypothetical protein